MKNLKILVCCHKKDLFKSSETFMPLHVGKALANIDLGMMGDDTGENISSKNASYCELTGMYWAWKNLKGVDYIGLCHYRRYFDFNHEGRRFFPSTTINTSSFDMLNLDISKKAENWLMQGGCIVAKPMHLHTSLYLQYCEGHCSPDFKIMGDVIRDTLPPEYFKGFWTYLVKSNRFSPYNMFVMSWSQFDAYCNWLFPLLEEIESRLDISHYPPYQKRVYGYLAERLLNLYVHTNKLKTMELPILKIADEPEMDDVSTFKYIFRCCIRDFVIKLLGNGQ